ncbi:pilus assembly protein [Motilibacter sp. K478]|nr:pilus assembly protein [Motilibacter aurantiacus]
MLVPLLVGLLQLGVVLHVRNTLTADASEGARYAANADRSPADGAALTRRLVTASFGQRLSPTVTARRATRGGLPVVEVRVVADLPLVGWLAGKADGLTVTARALDEEALRP